MVAARCSLVAVQPDLTADRRRVSKERIIDRTSRDAIMRFGCGGEHRTFELPLGGHPGTLPKRDRYHLSGEDQKRGRTTSVAVPADCDVRSGHAEGAGSKTDRAAQ